MNISFVIPVYNEASGIFDYVTRRLMPQIEKSAHEQKYSFDIIFVNDGSKDKTLQELYKLSDQFKQVKIVALSRNFGKELALTAGIDQALTNSDTDAILTMDADGQQPPEYIPQFIQKLQENLSKNGNQTEIITGVREKYGKHGLVAKLGSKLFYWMLSLFGSKTSLTGVTDFRLMTRSIAEKFSGLTEHNRITRGLIDWLGYPQDYITYPYGNRQFGKPSQSFRKLFGLAIDSFVSLSPAPLFIFAWIGVFITVLSGFLGIFALIQQGILGDPLGLHWSWLMLFMSFLIGLVLISQGVTALYIAQIQSEVLGRPLYLVNKSASRRITDETHRSPR
ncbi:MAG: glycosyltransferase [Candidatus Nomurabacteria bacterium]|jgi:dolichol-phosphate mannosyltransferase|nr:glycosyltransferase [Candidatus Nomurabacteria bacterium]